MIFSTSVFLRNPFATGVVDTGGAPWLANISGGVKLIHAKNQKQTSRDTVLLKGALGEKTLLSITSKTIGGYYLKSVEIMYFLKKIWNYFLGDITTFCKIFSQTDEKLLKKLSLEIMFKCFFGFEIRWRTLKSSPFALRWSDSYFESTNVFVGQFPLNWHANRWNPTKIAQTEANFWLHT